MLAIHWILDLFHTSDLLEEISSSQMKIGVSFPTRLPSLKIGVISEKLQPLLSYLEIFFLHSTTFKLVVNIIQVQTRSLLESRPSPNRHLDLQVLQPSDYPKIPVRKEHSITNLRVLLVLPPTRLVSISLVTTGSVRLHRVQYSVSKENLLLVVLLTSPSLHSLNLKELTATSDSSLDLPKLFVIRSQEQLHPNYLVMSILVELLILDSVLLLLVLVLLHSVQVEKNSRHISESLILIWIWSSPQLAVDLSMRTSLRVTMSLPSTMVLRMRIMDQFSVQLHMGWVSTSLVLHLMSKPLMMRLILMTKMYSSVTVV